MGGTTRTMTFLEEGLRFLLTHLPLDLNYAGGGFFKGVTEVYFFFIFVGDRGGDFGGGTGSTSSSGSMGDQGGF